MSAIKNIDELEFVLFCIDGIAAKTGKTTEAVYSALAENSNILNSYIVSNYDILHTQGKDYIIDDILRIMEEEGVVI